MAPIGRLIVKTKRERDERTLMRRTRANTSLSIVQGSADPTAVQRIDWESSQQRFLLLVVVAAERERQPTGSDRKLLAAIKRRGAFPNTALEVLEHHLTEARAWVKTPLGMAFFDRELERAMAPPANAEMKPRRL